MQEDQVHAVRAVYKDGTPATGHTPVGGLHVVCYFDAASRRNIILWEDILIPFKNALYARSGTKVHPFLKDTDFNRLEPPRISAIPNTVLDVVLEGQAAVNDHGAPSGPGTAITSSKTQPESEPDNSNNTESNANRSKVDTSTNQSRPSQNDAVPSSFSSSPSSSPLPNFETYPQDSNAQVILGRKYQEGDGIEQDYQAAMSLFLKAAEQGNIKGLRWVGYMYAEGLGVLQDFTMASKLYRRAAEHGDSTAQLNLGKLYDNGEGVQQDFAKAMEWFVKAAQQENTSAYCSIAYMYHNGRGVAQDPIKAFHWYHKAAVVQVNDTTVMASVAKAQTSIAHMYVEGRGGVSVDFTKAAEWYLKAAERGLSTAQHHIALLCDGGLGVAQDPVRAARWFKKAAAQGDASSQYKLGGLYAEGRGVAKDLRKAEKFYVRAAEQGYKKAQDELHPLRERMREVRQQYRQERIRRAKGMETETRGEE
ncbi:hypothetical protein BGZ47_007561 [Haplosporangium gracile]|nr:hypothetical protein BGZ47_007561 [Haplosporangium gracile]